MTEIERLSAAVTFKLKRILVNCNRYRGDEPLQVQLETAVEREKLWLRFACEGKQQSLAIPIPYKDSYGSTVIGRDVVRAVGTWCHKDDDGSWTEKGYWELISWLLCGSIEKTFPSAGKRSQLERLVQSFGHSGAPLTFRSCQDLINGLVNKLPLTGTPLETWAMCHRVVFLDPEFDRLTPEGALDYQVALNKNLFPWTSLGLSDSGMVRNYLLKEDLRRFTPFGLRHHNPMRNLYQTLGMRGDEDPVVLSESAAQLAAKQGVERRGWNWMTCFLDTPLNFEDQLVIDLRHLDKFTLETRRVVCFGEVAIAAGDDLEEGDLLSVEPNGKELRWWVRADSALVVGIEQETACFNGEERDVQVVHVETKHTFKEGVKLTNSHGNKGVATFADCGSMWDAGRQCHVPIDIVVSACAIKKRRNYGQVLEALTTLLRGTGERIVLKDDVHAPLSDIRAALTKRGYAADGTSPVKTPWGEHQALCGWVFWGVIKNPEVQLWTQTETRCKDNQGLRQAGTKISHIELKGLTTIFGPRSPVVQEILSHQQGVDSVLELVKVLEGLRGATVQAPLVDWSAIKPVVQDERYFHLKGELSRTIADEGFYPDGFVLALPRIFHVFIPDDPRSEPEHALLPEGFKPLQSAAKPKGVNVFLDKVYVPHAPLRASWEHPTGFWGLSDLGGYLNNVILACHALGRGPHGDTNLLRALNRYFFRISHRLSTKRGEIATYCLAVRYPWSVKATATLAKEGLPANWVEIHESMAADLRVKSGDYVLTERFPCLGFKSLRIQRVRVTEDPQCRFVVRVSGNSLISQGLDFDGDVLFIMSFQTQKARQALAQEFLVPDALRKRFLDEANAKSVPFTAAPTLDSLEMEEFPPLTRERQAEIVASLTGLKRGTGTVVALAYNLMRIIEGNVGYADRDTNLGMEVILDTVAKSVFGQKHVGVEVSLEERCKQAVCTADLEEMLSMGFPENASRKLCEIIRKEAASLGIRDLHLHFRKHKETGRSNLINTVVRRKHPLYFATRADLHPVKLLGCLDSPPNDLVSHLWYRGKRMYEKGTALVPG